MRLTYPGMRLVDRLLWERPNEAMARARFAGAIGGQVLLTTEPGPGPTFADFKRTHRTVTGEWDRDVLWVAPWWIAWLYRWLPCSIGWHNGPEHQHGRPAWYLWVVHAPAWRLGWLPAGRSPGYAARWGVLHLGPRTIRL